MDMTFRTAHSDEYPRVSRFIDEFWLQDHIYCRDRPLFEWTFRSPLWHEPGYSVILGEDGGELVGILGGIPFLKNTFGSYSAGVWIVNYVVRPDHRKGANALRLLGSFRKPPYETTIAFGINPATTTIYRVLRGQVLPLIPRHFLVMPDSVHRVANLLRMSSAAWTREDADSAARSLCIGGVPAGEIPHTDTVPDTWDQNDWPAIAAATVSASRDAAYLSWRYRRHPTFQYRFLAIADGDRTGLLVWRLETIRLDGPHGREDYAPFGRVLEFLPASEDNAASLFDVLLQQLSAAGAIGADYYGYHGPTRAVLERLGFHSTASIPGGERLPARFQPVDSKGGEIMSAMFTDPGGVACDLDPACPWIWTKSDADQDRPN